MTDSEGHKKAVILPIEECNELCEDLDDLACVAERRDELREACEMALKNLKEDGHPAGGLSERVPLSVK